MFGKPTTINMETITCPKCHREIWLPTGDVDHCPCTQKTPLQLEEHDCKTQELDGPTNDINKGVNDGTE